MNLQQYIESKTTGKLKKIPSDILSNWIARNGASYAPQGAAGAQVYIGQFAKTAAAPKLIFLGRLALETGNAEFAAEFFKRAAQLEKVELEVSDIGKAIATAITEVQRATVRVADHPGFPSGAQPGKFAAMQPVDGKRDQAHYVSAPGYWGQPKRDGNKLIVFATADNIFYQSRQMKLNTMPSGQLDNELRNAARVHGNFICEGEFTYLSAAGKEHRTASQAQRWNAETLNQPTVLPVMKYYIFNCVWREHQMLRMYGDMVKEGHMLAGHIKAILGSQIVEPVEIARTTAEKCALVERQKREGREGEVWFTPLMAYQAGKHNDETYIRTKYGEEITVMVVGFKEGTAPGFAFGSMKIESLDGRDLGSVGNGWSAPQSRKLMDTFEAIGPFPVNVYTRGYTEDGKCWEASYIDFAN